MTPQELAYRLEKIGFTVWLKHKSWDWGQIGTIYYKKDEHFGNIYDDQSITGTDEAGPVQLGPNVIKLLYFQDYLQITEVFFYLEQGADANGVRLTVDNGKFFLYLGIA